MTLDSLDLEAQTLAPSGDVADLAGPPVALRSPARPTRKRAPDYRLRGLDLDAPGLVDTPTRRGRNRHSSHRAHRRRRLVQTVVVLAVSVVVAIVLQRSVVQPYTVSSGSMLPTLERGTGVLVVKPTWLTGPIEAGDVVVVRQPDGASCGPAGSDEVVKRVVGLPGQTIWSVGQRIYIDGEVLEEPGWYNPPFGEVGTSRVPRTSLSEDSYFVLGDNRTDTCDSRAFGPVPASDVVGTVVSTITRGGHPSVHRL